MADPQRREGGADRAPPAARWAEDGVAPRGERRRGARGAAVWLAAALLGVACALTPAEAYSERKPFGDHESHTWAKDSTHTKRMPVASVSPLIGPEAGGTKVTLRPEGALPEDQKFFYCQFGDTTVIADSFYTLHGRPAIVCTAPKGESYKSVPLRLSYDGLTFTDSGVDFHYHPELSIAQVSPAAGTLAGGIEVMLKVRGKLAGSGFNDAMAAEAKCRFDDKEVPARFENLEGDELYSKFKCIAPAAENVGVVDLRVSLDGQSYSKNRGSYTYLYSAQAEEGDDANLEMHQMLRKFGEPTEVAPTVFQTTFYDFYGFYGFYEFSFYDFYGVVKSEYEAEADEGEGLNDVNELPPASTTMKISELCMVAIAPAVGPATGGTRVTLKLAGAVPEGQQLFYCKFGSTVVPADSFYYTADSASPAIVCTAPPGEAYESVTLKFSLDGDEFTAAGATFYYHDSISVDMMMPSAASTIGGTNVMLQLSSNPLQASFASETVTVPATCKFDGIEVPGEYLHAVSGDNDAPRIVCPTPPMDVGVVDLYISLDGQSYNERPAPFTVLLGMPEEPDFGFSRQDRTLPGIMREGPFVADEEYERGFYEFYHFYSTFYNFFYFYQDFYGATDQMEAPVALPKLPTYNTPAIATTFDYLPFSPDYCAFFDTGPDATLEVLKLSDGVLSPVFNPSTTVYFAAVPKDVATINVLAIASDPLASVRVNGEKIAQGAVAVRGGKKSSDIALSVGENLVTVVTTAQDGKTKEYSVVVVRLAGTDSSLAYLAVHPNTTEEIGFEPDTLSYTLTVVFRVKQTFVVARPADRDATIVVKVNGEEGQIMTSEVSPLLNLDVGYNLLEVIVYAEDGIAITTYTFLVLRLTGSELVALDVFAPDLSNQLTGFAYVPAFNETIFTYTLYAPTIAPTAFVRAVSRDPSAVITMTTRHDALAGGAGMMRRDLKQDANGCDPATGQNYGDFVLQHGLVSDSICLVFGTNTFEVTVKYGPNPPATYTLIITRPPADAFLENLFGYDVLLPGDPILMDTGHTPPKRADGTCKRSPCIDSLSLVQYIHIPYQFNHARVVFVANALAYRMTVYTIGASTPEFEISTEEGFIETVLPQCGLVDQYGYHVSIIGSDRYTVRNYTVYVNRQSRPEHGTLQGLALRDTSSAELFTPSFQPAILTYDYIVKRAYNDGSVSVIGTTPVYVGYQGYANVTLSGLNGENLLPRGPVVSYTERVDYEDLYQNFTTTYQPYVGGQPLNVYGVFSSGPHQTKYVGTYSSGEMEINPIKATVVACDNFTINTYVLNARRSDGDNARLCGVQASRGPGITPFNGAELEQTLYIPSFEDGNGGVVTITTITCDPYADAGVGYSVAANYTDREDYGFGSPTGAASFDITLPAHIGNSEPEMLMWIYVTAQNGVAFTAYRLKVVHLIGKTATLDGLIVRGYTCPSYPCTGNCIESSCWSYPGTGFQRTAMVPGLEQAPGRRLLAAAEQGPNSTRMCDETSGCTVLDSPEPTVGEEPVFETVIPFTDDLEKLGATLTALDEDPAYRRSSRSLQQLPITSIPVSLAPGGSPYALEQYGVVPWQYGYVTIAPLCTDTRCSSVAVDGQVFGGHGVESGLVPLNGELSFLPGNTRLSVLVRPHDTTAPAKEYYVKMSREIDANANIQELGIVGIDILTGDKSPGRCAFTGTDEVHLNPAGVPTSGAVIHCNVDPSSGRASVVPYTENPYAEFMIDQFNSRGDTPYLYIKYGAEADPPLPNTGELAFESNGPIRATVTATDQESRRQYYIYIYRGVLNVSILRNITLETYDPDAVPPLPTNAQMELPFEADPWIATYNGKDRTVEYGPGNLIPPFNASYYTMFPDQAMNRFHTQVYYSSRVPVVAKWARLRLIPEDRLAAITINGVPCVTSGEAYFGRRTNLPETSFPLSCRQLNGAAGRTPDGRLAVFTALIQIPYPDALTLNVVVKSADMTTETRYGLIIVRNNPHLETLEVRNFYEYYGEVRPFPLVKADTPRWMSPRVDPSVLWAPPLPYQEETYDIRCLAPKLASNEGVVNLLAVGHGGNVTVAAGTTGERTAQTFAEFPVVTVFSPVIDRSLPEPAFDPAAPSPNFDFVMKLGIGVGVGGGGYDLPNNTDIEIYKDRITPEFTQTRIEVLAIDNELRKMYTLDIERQIGDLADFREIAVNGDNYAFRIDPEDAGPAIARRARPEEFNRLDLTECGWAIRFPAQVTDIVITATMWDPDATYYVNSPSGRLGKSDTDGFNSGDPAPAVTLKDGKNVFGMEGIPEDAAEPLVTDLCVFKLASDIPFLKELLVVDALYDEDGTKLNTVPGFTPFPDFEKEVLLYNYNAEVFKYQGQTEPKVRTTTELIVVPYEEDALIRINGVEVANNYDPKTVALSEDEATLILIDVTAPDGDARQQYQLVVRRAPGNSTALDFVALAEVGQTFSQSSELEPFPGTPAAYFIDVPYTMLSAKLFFQPFDKDTTITINGDAPSMLLPLQTQTIELKDNDNLVQIKVLSENGNFEATYDVHVYRSQVPRGSNRLTSLGIATSGTEMYPDFDPDVLGYTAYVGSAAQITLTRAAESTEARVVVTSTSVSCSDQYGGGWRNKTSAKLSPEGLVVPADRIVESTGVCPTSGELLVSYGFTVIEVEVINGDVSSTYRILVYRDVPRAGPVNDKFSYYTPDDFLRVYSSTALAEQMMLSAFSISGPSGHVGPAFSPQTSFYYAGTSTFARSATLAATPFYAGGNTYINGRTTTDGSKVQVVNEAGQNFALVRTEGDGFVQDAVALVDVASGLGVDVIAARDQQGRTFRAQQYGNAGTCISLFNVYSYSEGCDEYEVLLPFSASEASVLVLPSEHTSEVTVVDAFSNALPDVAVPPGGPAAVAYNTTTQAFPLSVESSTVIEFELRTVPAAGVPLERRRIKVFLTRLTADEARLRTLRVLADKQKQAPPQPPIDVAVREDFGLVPPFGSNNEVYTVTIPKSMHSVVIEAVPLDPGVRSIFIGDAGTPTPAGELSSGIELTGSSLPGATPQLVTVVVSSLDGTQKTYTIRLVRQPSSNAKLENLRVTARSFLTGSPVEVGALSPLFSATKDPSVTYAAQVPHEVVFVSIVFDSEIDSGYERSARVAIEGDVQDQSSIGEYKYYPSGSTTADLGPVYVYTDAIQRTPAPNTIRVLVTAEDGVTRNTYQVSVGRAPSSDARVKTIKFQTGLNEWDVYSAMRRLYPDPAFNPAVRAWWTYPTAEITGGTMLVEANANQRDPWAPAGAFVKVEGAGALGANAISALSNASGTIGTEDANRILEDGILTGANPVQIFTVAQDGINLDQYVLNVTRLGKPVLVSVRIPGVISVDDARNRPEVQDALIGSILAIIQAFPFQAYITSVVPGSVILNMNIYPLIRTIRDPYASLQEKQIVEAAVQAEVLAIGDRYATILMSADGSVIDLGVYGGVVEIEVLEISTPLIPREGPCPPCPASYKSLRTEAPGFTDRFYCKCIRIPDDDELETGEIVAAVMVAVVVFIVGLFLGYYYYRREKTTNAILAAVVARSPRDDRLTTTDVANLNPEFKPVKSEVKSELPATRAQIAKRAERERGGAPPPTAAQPQPGRGPLATARVRSRPISLDDDELVTDPEAIRLLTQESEQGDLPTRQQADAPVSEDSLRRGGSQARR